MTADRLDSIAGAFNDLLRLLRDADPRDKAELHKHGRMPRRGRVDRTTEL